MLLHDTTISKSGEAFSAELVPRWEIWGPNGGYLAAIALRAAGEVAPQDHRPASFSCQFISTGKMSGVDIGVSIQKQGRSASLVNVTISQAEKLLLQAQVWSTSKTEGPVVSQEPMPVVPQPEELLDYGKLHEGKGKPHPFWTNMDVRPVDLPWPADHQRDAMLRWWIKFPEYETVNNQFADQARCVIPIDTFCWPTHWRTRPSGPHYMGPTAELSVWFQETPGPAEWLLVESSAQSASAGLILGHAKVWSRDGRFLARGGGNMIFTEMKR